MIKAQQKPSKLIISRLVAVAFIVGVFPLLSITKVSAAQIEDRSVTLSSSVGDASGVSYSLATSALPSTTPVKSLEIKFCSSLTGACVTPAGFSALSSTLDAQPTGLGATSGWTVSAATQGSLRIINASNSTQPSGLVAVKWNSVHNPTVNNATFYGVITTYSDSGWTNAIDAGSVALSTSTQIQVALKVDETLTFCSGTSITGQDCSTVAGNVVDLGSGSVSATATGTSVISASTNGDSGYSVMVSGNTLTSGGNEITALQAGGSSSKGTKQFGFNLAAGNTTPVVGTAVTGAGTATATANYGTNNTFRFKTDEVIASASGPTNGNTFTVGYIANIDGVTPVGAYTSNLTYTATSNF